MLRIHLLEAENLIPKDNFIGSMVKGKSDPYVKMTILDKTFKSNVIKENLNPTWHELYEVNKLFSWFQILIINKRKSIRTNIEILTPSQYLFWLQLVLAPVVASDIIVEVFDKDIDKDDFLGR